ncbi:MAG TPA: hypothetical protein PK359_10005, partial [Burkholderiaceae bacterium]|nr:hypothetical protein [Burkholderiaceae bacterium]
RAGGHGPAILNAIHHATGVRVGQVPVTPARLRAAIRSDAARNGAIQTRVTRTPAAAGDAVDAPTIRESPR